MTGEFGEAAEGLAEAGTGAAIARAVEPTASEVSGHTHEAACLNCGTPVAGPHCHECGQRAHVHRTLTAFFHDLLHGVLHFEGKTWRTIPLLVWQPGRLTREYIDGKRARYVSPIALFLFVVFLSFALFNALGGDESVTSDVRGIEQARALDDALDREIATLEAERATADPSRRSAIEARLGELRDSRNDVRQVLSAVDEADGEGFRSRVDTDPILRNTALADVIDHVRANPQLAIYKAQTSAYKYSWMLIPLSVPFVWLLFAFNRRFHAYDHTVFTTYSITFMIALLALASLLTYAGAGGSGLLVLLFAPFHMYRQLRGTYALSRAGALWRMLALSLFAWLAIALFAVGIFWMAAS